jgi:hypothetical protein
MATQSTSVDAKLEIGQLAHSFPLTHDVFPFVPWYDVDIRGWRDAGVETGFVTRAACVPPCVGPPFGNDRGPLCETVPF